MNTEDYNRVWRVYSRAGKRIARQKALRALGTAIGMLILAAVIGYTLMAAVNEP